MVAAPGDPGRLAYTAGVKKILLLALAALAATAAAQAARRAERTRRRADAWARRTDPVA